MKLLVFGGTFDPPHYGHLSLLRNAIQAVKPDRVVVMVAGIPPHKKASATPADLRLEMCRCFEPLFPELEISDIEIQRGDKSYTWDTVMQLRKRYPDAEIHLCIGGDMLLVFKSWRNWKHLLRAVTLVVQGRDQQQDHELKRAAEELRQQGAEIVFTQGSVLKISSSGIRAAIAAGADPVEMLPPPAGEIVKTNRLYVV